MKGREWGKEHKSSRFPMAYEKIEQANEMLSKLFWKAWKEHTKVKLLLTPSLLF
jgi:hypothetical protein